MSSILDFAPPRASESWYFWFYSAGLKGIPWEEIVAFANSSGKIIRPKDYDNYVRGFHKHSDPFAVEIPKRSLPDSIEAFPRFKQDHREPFDKWIPCNKDCKPLVKWSQTRCTLMEAQAYRHCEVLGINNKGCHHVTIDVDADHDGPIDMSVVEYWKPWIQMTKARVKWSPDGTPASFHLDFYTDRIMPTYHLPKLDLLGNQQNQVIYLKPNKVDNGLPMMELNDFVWKELKRYAELQCR